MKKTCRLILFVIILFGVSNVCLSFVKSGNAHINEYITNLTNADVLVIGSSHAYVNLNGAVLWNECGIPSACLGQGEQPVCMSYYTLKSALRYGKPKLVIFETYMAVVGDTYNNFPNQYVNSLLGFSFFKNADCRIEASSFLVDQDRSEYILGFPLYHSNYSNSKTEETLTAGYEFVFFQNQDGQLEDRESILTERRRVPLSETVNEYLLKTIELCREKDIELLFLVTPYQASSEHIQVFNSVADLADNESVEFIDMNSRVNEIGINLSREMADNGHAMPEGAKKNSIWLGDYLMNTYLLEDRRGDEAYEAWNNVYADYLERISVGK